MRYFARIAIGVCLVLTLLLSGCSGSRFTKDGPPGFDVDVSRIPDALPRWEAKSRYGNPSSYVVRGRRYYVLPSAHGYVARGIASWYGTKFHAHLTSDREAYNMLAMTAASKVLPLPTYARVTNLRNDRSVVVRVNDRGPFVENRIIDLSYVAAKKLGMLPYGTALVEVRAIDPRHPETYEQPKTEFNVFHRPNIYLQVGAYAQHRNAERVYLLLKHKLPRYGVVVRQDSRHGKIIYRVQIGPFPNVAASDKIYNELHALGFEERAVTIK